MLNQRKTTLLFSICAFSIALAIALDAFGAHGLKKVLSEQKLDTFKTAGKYLLFQNLGVILILLLKNTDKFRIIDSAIYTLIAGTWIFSISVYLAAFSELNGLDNLKYAGAIAPIGGILMIASWVILGFGVLKSNKK